MNSSCLLLSSVHSSSSSLLSLSSLSLAALTDAAAAIAAASAWSASNSSTVWEWTRDGAVPSGLKCLSYHNEKRMHSRSHEHNEQLPYTIHLPYLVLADPSLSSISLYSVPSLVSLTSTSTWPWIEIIIIFSTKGNKPHQPYRHLHLHLSDHFSPLSLDSPRSHLPANQDIRPNVERVSQLI